MALTAERTVPSTRTGRKEVITTFAPAELKAPFALRCAAVSIDYILLISIPVISLILGTVVGGAGPSRGGGSSSGLGWILGVLLFITNFVILPAVNGQSIGKLLTGLRIVGIDGRDVGFGAIVLRNVLGYALSFLTLGFGFLLALLLSNGRALHDLLAKTIVVYAHKNVR
jgi:uncharacterized RDD family membrane protein YckC